MDVDINTLPNGLTHINIPIKDKKSATVLVLVGTGSRHEDLKNNGISHFIEHMLFKGTQKRPSAINISEEIDALGADYNAFTSKEYTGYYIKAASSSIRNSIEILADMINNSKFDPDECEKEKGVIIEEINMYLDTPMRQIGSIFEDLIYLPHPLGYDTAGTKETVQSFSREDFIQYKSNWYQPSRMVIVTAGGIPSDIQTIIKQHFNAAQSDSSHANLDHFKNIQESPLIRIHHKKSDQAHFCIGLRSFPIGDPRRYVMSVFNTIMGGNMSSRLFVDLREKRGLCYYVSSDNDAYLDTGEWIIQAGVDTLRTEESLEATLAELVRVKNYGITESEVQKAKQYLNGRLALGLEESKGVANLYGINMLLENKVRSPQEIEQGIAAVTAESINQMAQTLIQKDQLAYAIIGPFADDTEDKVRSIIDKTL